jgi:hypothetical protein
VAGFDWNMHRLPIFDVDLGLMFVPPKVAPVNEKLQIYRTKQRQQRQKGQGRGPLKAEQILPQESAYEAADVGAHLQFSAVDFGSAAVVLICALLGYPDNRWRLVRSKVDKEMKLLPL